jgi:excinuclease ABC subunit A
MRVAEALEVFGNIPKIRAVLQTLADVGLDYLSLGQSAPTLSGGEAQRVKLAAELSRPNTGRTLYLLDEPTTGLHFDDIHKLLEVLNRLVDLGNTAIVVEHNLDVIKTADWIIDLGPEAGDAGGYVVVEGTPEMIVEEGKGSPLHARQRTRNDEPIRSHTAEALAPVLGAGPVTERVKYDPLVAATPRADDVPLEAVGKDAKMPWETDGRRWHTAERLSHNGKPCRWEGAILPFVEELVHKAGQFAPTDWNQQSIVEIAAPVKSQGWFLHAMTGMEWLVRLVFRVKRNQFRQADLVGRLGIRPLNETPGLEVYGDEDRVRVTHHKGPPWDSVTVLAHRLSEVDTPAFRQLIKEAAASFHAGLKRMQTKPEDVMPWKVNGQRWHLGDKGFPAGKRVAWDRTLLPRLLDLVQEIVPDLHVDWDARAAISLRIPGISRAWAQWRTKEAFGLDCRFVGKKGQLNLSQLEGLGVSPGIHSHRADVDLLRLVFQRADHAPAAKLKEVLGAHLRGFREVFGK